MALLIFDRNLIPMLFLVITRIFSIFVSQTCGSLWPGRKSLRQKNLIKIAKRSTSSIENCSHSEMNGQLIAPGSVFPRVQCSAPYAQKEGRKMNSRRKTAAKHSSSSSSSSGILPVWVFWRTFKLFNFNLHLLLGIDQPVQNFPLTIKPKIKIILIE